MIINLKIFILFKFIKLNGTKILIILKDLNLKMTYLKKKSCMIY